MWLDSIEDLDIWESSWEKAQESASEKKEKAAKSAKAIAWIQKTRKDEKKAQKDNNFLYQIIIDIIQNPKYDAIIPFVSELLKHWIPSNIIIWGISLVYNEAAYIIRNNYLQWNTSLVFDKKSAQEFKVIINYNKTKDVIEFRDDNLHEAIKWRINEWIEDIINVISFDPSNIVTAKFLQLVNNKPNEDEEVIEYNKNKESINKKTLIINYLASILTFFLLSLNIVISKDKALLYADFILWEVVKKMKEIKLDEDFI